MDLIIQEMVTKYQQLYTLKGNSEEFKARI